MDSSPTDAPALASSAEQEPVIVDRPDPAGPPARTSPVPAVLLGLVAALVYATYSVLQWRLLVSPSWDLGIFTQLAKAYASFSAPIVPIKGDGFNLLGDHFHPILVLLGPFYALFPSGLTLLIIQGVLFAASAAVVAHTASRLLGRGAGLLVGGAYAASWGLQAAIASQFHEIAFAVPLLALALSGLLLSRWRLAIIAAGALVFVKEDLGATVIVIGIVLAWRRGEPQRLAAPAASGLVHRLRRALGSLHLSGLLLSAWGAVWLVLTVTVLLPALNPGGQFDYGGRIAVGEILANPIAAIGLLLVPAPKTTTLLALLVIGAVVWVRSPLALIVVPTILWRFWAGEQFYWSTDWHYSAILMPVVFLALADVVARRGPRLPGASRLADPLRSAPVAAAIVALALLPQHALADLAKDDTWRGADEARAAGAAAVLEVIPDGATVVSDISLMAYLVPDHEVYWLGNEGDPPPDYIVVDRISASWSDGPDEADVQAENRHPGTDYEVILDAGGYQVAERR